MPFSKHVPLSKPPLSVKPIEIGHYPAFFTGSGNFGKTIA